MSDKQKKFYKIMLKPVIAVAVIETSVALITLDRTSLGIAIGAILASVFIWAKLRKEH